ncbi:MAG: 2-dehydropantoate 2-reductase [Propionibacteriaceae bacterium]|jgi:2-dehydropantoate 2-reductase|nr:2-dehydropantoate 2-reductase [Propionibacteriaceae bacterium]
MTDVAVIGAGAIGAYYGAHLARADHTVHFLARSTAAELRQHGLAIKSWRGDLAVDSIQAYSAPSQMPPCDLVLLATKATANKTVFEQIRPVLKDGSQLVVMQNGFGAEPVLARMYPAVKLFAGLCFICSFRTDQPWVIQHTAYGRLSLAALNPADQDSLEEIAQLFDQAGVDVERLGGVLEARLRKLVWNVPFNGLSVVLNATTGQLSRSPAARGAIAGLMAEVTGAAAAGGVEIEPSFAAKMMGTTDAMAAYNPSMRLDYLAGRPLEIDAIYWNVINWAAGLGYAMPACSLLARQLEYLSQP